MPKRIDITDEIKAKIKANMGSEPNYDQIAVFEMTAVTSLPLSKRWSIYDKAQITMATFEEAAAYLNQGGFVPFHTLHNQGYEIPVGRVFYGEAQKNAKGFDELRVLAFIDTAAHADLADKMDNGIVEEVSVGMSFKQLLCSACGDDLLSDMGKVWDRTCANGHVIGMGDHHVKPNGLGVFSELSAVSKGASQGAKILGMQKRNLAASLERSDLALAASVKADPELMLFTPHANLDTTNEGEDPVLIAELQAKLDAAEAEKVALTAAKDAAEAKLATAEAEKATLVAAKDAAEAEKVTLTAAKDTAEAELATVKTELEAATTAKTEAESKLVAAQNELQGLKDAESARLSVRPFKIPLGGIQGLDATHTDVAAKSKPVVAGPSPAFKTPK